MEILLVLLNKLAVKLDRFRFTLLYLGSHSYFGPAFDEAYEKYQKLDRQGKIAFRTFPTFDLNHAKAILNGRITISGMSTKKYKYQLSQLRALFNSQ